MSLYPYHRNQHSPRTLAPARVRTPSGGQVGNRRAEAVILNRPTVVAKQPTLPIRCRWVPAIFTVLFLLFGCGYYVPRYLTTEINILEKAQRNSTAWQLLNADRQTTADAVLPCRGPQDIDMPHSAGQSKTTRSRNVNAIQVAASANCPMEYAAPGTSGLPGNGRVW